MSSFVSLDAASLTPNDAYKLIIGSVLPRPIAFVSTLSPSGIANLAPFSFFNGVCSNPPTLMFSVMRRGADGAKKDTLFNIEKTGEFVVNIVSESIVEAMNLTAGEYPSDISEFEVSGLTQLPSFLIKPARVQESLVQLECKLNQIVEIGEGGLGSGSIVIGTIVYFHLNNQVYENGRILTDVLKPVARLAGSSYCPVRDVFEVARPVLK
ncbi:MAG: flavin reductase family protein [Cyanobacteria bacterium]|nr:flavin reductase family protein [Cyanobacteriota bacterium]